MKAVKELLIMLVCELVKHLNDVKSVNKKVVYYNEILGDTSFLLAGILQSLLNGFKDWDKRKWFDDSLLTSILIQNEKLTIKGIMIWGKKNTTEQWTEPFSFEIVICENKSSFKEYTFLFSDLDKPEITYEEFRENRNYWDQDEINWKYIINQKASEESR
jgi:hypothetical protein